MNYLHYKDFSYNISCYFSELITEKLLHELKFFIANDSIFYI